MRANQIRWLLLFAVVLAILGAIQCPSSPKRLTGSLRSFGAGIVRTLSRGRSRSSSRSGQSIPRADDHSDSDSESDMEPASGYDRGSGSGRLPRSRSPTPAVGGGGGASSSSSNEPAITRMKAGIYLTEITSTCRDVNNRGDAHVVTNMKVSEFVRIITAMRHVAENDECRRSTKGIVVGSNICQEIYAEFKKIPPQYRGECSDAISSQCYVWRSGTRTQQDGKICSFFMKTGMRSSTRADGYWVSLADCIKGIKDELFMSNQLSSVGINPPQNAPQPLLPHNYSPEH